MAAEAQVPQTTAWTIIFSYEDKPKMYNRDSYSPQLTHGRASTQEVDQVLSQIEAIKNPIHSQIQTHSIIWMLTINLLFVGLFVYFINDSDTNSNVIPYGVLVFIAVLIGGFLRYYFLNKRIRNQCQQAFESEINPKFASRGLRWHFAGDWPYWIELHNDFLGKGSSGYQQIVPQPYETENTQAYETFDGFSNQNTGGQLHLQIYQGEPQYSANLYMPPSYH